MVVVDVVEGGVGVGVAVEVGVGVSVGVGVLELVVEHADALVKSRVIVEVTIKLPLASGQEAYD